MTKTPKRLRITKVVNEETNVNIPYLEHHGLVGIVRHPQLEMPSREGEARGPEGLQLRHVHDAGLLLRLGSVPQVARWHAALEVTASQYGVVWCKSKKV
jgi:hypothetical protein